MNRYQHPSERGFDFPPPGPARPSQSPLIESAARFGIFGIGTSESKSATTTTDQKSSTESGDITNISGVGKKAKVLDDSVLLEGSSQLGGTRTGAVGAGGTVVGGDLHTTSLDFAGARIGDDNSSEVKDSTIVGGDVLTTNLDFAGARIGDDNSSRLDFAGARIGDDNSSRLDFAGARIGDDVDNSLDLSGARFGDDVDNSLDLSGARFGDDTDTTIGNVTVNDGKLLTDTMDYFAAFAKDSETSRDKSLAGILELTKLTERNRADADENAGETLADLLDATTAAKTAADPEAQKNQTILWIVLAMLAFLFFRK